MKSLPNAHTSFGDEARDYLKAASITTHHLPAVRCAGRLAWRRIAGACFSGTLAFLPLAKLAAAEKLPAEWPVAKPEKLGLSEHRLEEAWRVLRQNQSTTFLVIRSDHVVFERYAPGNSRTTPHYTASLAKALVGGMSLAVAMADDRIHPSDAASKFVPAWQGDEKKRAITIAQLATHTSGLDDANEPDVPHRQLTGWKGDFWRFLPPPRDPFTLARDEVPLIAPPGTQAIYSNPGMAMLGYCITASLQGSAYPDLAALLRQRVMSKIGVPDSEWSVGYSGPISLDGLSLIGTWGGANFSPNATARVGRLLARQGDWDETQVLPLAVVREITKYAGLPNRSGLGWWVNKQPNGSRVFSQAPDDAFWGLGAGGQFLFVVPSLDLIIVRNGNLPRGDTFRQVERLVVNPVLGAFVHETTGPYLAPSRN